jgi:hypothetical protein
MAEWHEEYSEGMTMEIYSFKLKHDLIGIRFSELVTCLCFRVFSHVRADAYAQTCRTDAD